MAETKTTRTDADAVAELARSAAQAPFVHKTEDGRLFAFLPVGSDRWDRSEITDPLRAPAKLPVISQVVTLQTLESLVDYAVRYRTDETTLFADIEANLIRAVIDYHAPNQAERGLHRANLRLPHSEEWKAWTAIDGKYFDQLAFARFLEENAADIEAPSGADLLEVCRDLHAVRTMDFRKAIRTQTDNESFEFTDNTETKSRSSGHALELPSKFQLRIPVYFDGEIVSLFAFLRWRLEEGRLLLGIQLHRAEHVRQAVFKQIVMTAADQIDRQAVFGRLASAD